MVTKILNRENAKSLLVYNEYYRLVDISKLLIDLSNEEVEKLDVDIMNSNIVSIILYEGPTKTIYQFSDCETNLPEIKEFKLISAHKLEAKNLVVHIRDVIELFKKLELLDESSLGAFMAIYLDMVQSGGQNDNQTLFN
jgi:hypothetical protein